MDRCRDCGRTTKDLYWISTVGTKLTKPRCRECHEQAVRLRTRTDDDKPDYKILPLWKHE